MNSDWWFKHILTNTAEFGPPDVVYLDDQRPECVGGHKNKQA